MTQTDMNFPRLAHSHRRCKSKGREYPFCECLLPNTEEIFGRSVAANPRCLRCGRLWEGMWDRTLIQLERFMDLRDKNAEINKDTRTDFWRYLTQHFQPIYLAAIKAGDDLEKKAEEWEWDCNKLALSFAEDQEKKHPALIHPIDKAVKPCTNLIYVFEWVRFDGSTDLRGGCPFGITGNIKQRRIQLSPKHGDLRLRLVATWDMGHRRARKVETSIKSWNRTMNQIKTEVLDMEIESAMICIEGFIKHAGFRVARGAGD